MPRANAAACPQLAKADFASSSQHVRDGQRIAALARELDDLRRIEEALVIGGEGERAPGASVEAVLQVSVSRGAKAAA